MGTLDLTRDNRRLFFPERFSISGVVIIFFSIEADVVRALASTAL
jgi:hypothetical protein